MIGFVVPELKEFFPLAPDPRKCRVLNEPLEEFLRRELAALPDGVRWRMDCTYYKRNKYHRNESCIDKCMRNNLHIDNAFDKVL